MFLRFFLPVVFRCFAYYSELWFGPVVVLVVLVRGTRRFVFRSSEFFLDDVLVVCGAGFAFGGDVWAPNYVV